MFFLFQSRPLSIKKKKRKNIPRVRKKRGKSWSCEFLYTLFFFFNGVTVTLSSGSPRKLLVTSTCDIKKNIKRGKSWSCNLFLTELLVLSGIYTQYSFTSSDPVYNTFSPRLSTTEETFSFNSTFHLTPRPQGA